jgi:hypothetical protein
MCATKSGCGFEGLIIKAHKLLRLISVLHRRGKGTITFSFTLTASDLESVAIKVNTSR